MAQSRKDVTKVPIPPGVWAGQLIGRGGVNTRWLHIHSGGAHITVNDLDVTIRSKDAHVRTRAAHMVRRQLEAMVKFGTHDTLPPFRLEYVLLESTFGCDPRVRFSLRNDEVAAASMKKGKLFALDLVPLSCCDGGDSTTNVMGVTSTIMDGGGGGGGGDNGDKRLGAGDDGAGDAPLLAEVSCWVVASETSCGTSGDGAAIATVDAAAGCAPAKVSSQSCSLTPQPYVQSLLSPHYEEPLPSAALPLTTPTPTPTTSSSEYTTTSTPPPNPTTTLRFHSTVHGSCHCVGDCGGASDSGLTSPHSARRSKLLGPVAETLALAIRYAVDREPGFDVLKIRFHLGKHLFRNLGSRAGKPELSVSDLEGGGSGRGAFRSVFSNFVPASAVPRVTSWLTDTLGFTLTDTKTTATFHVINQELNVHYSVALQMERGDDTTSSLRKVKYGGSRFLAVALLAAPYQLDLRLKLVALAAQSGSREQTGCEFDSDAYLTARRVAAAVRTEGFDAFTRSKRGLPRNRHLEYARRKTKFVYEGCLPASGEGGCGQRLRVSVIQVQDDKGSHYEVSGCLPEVDAKLRQLLSRQQQQLQQRPARVAAEEFMMWRRHKRNGGDAAVGSTLGLYDSSSGMFKTNPTTAISDGRESTWALEALTGLSEFVTQLNDTLFAEGVPPATT